MVSESIPAEKFGWRYWLPKLAMGLVILSCVFTLSARVGLFLPSPLNWLFSMPTHFRHFYWIIQWIAFVGLCFAYFRQVSPQFLKKAAFVILPFFIINSAWLLPYYWPVKTPVSPDATGSQPTKIFLINLGEPADFFPLIEQIQVEKPQILAVVEHSRKLAEILNHPAWKQDYPYRYVDWNAELGLYSKFPLEHVQLRQSPKIAPSLTATVTLNNWPVQLLLARPSVPTNPQNWERQRAQFAEWQKLKPGRWIVMGDFNTTPWMPHFAIAKEGADLRDTAWGVVSSPPGRWIITCWPCRLIRC